MSIKNKYSLEIIIIFFIVGITTILVVYSENQYILNEKISNDYYSNKSLRFIVESDDDLTINEVFGNISSVDILYNEINNDIVAVYGKDISFPLLNGRNIRTDDYNSRKRVAILGANIESTNIINEVEYFNFNGIEYEVIGRIGLNKESKLDNKIYINILETDIVQEGTWILDGDNTEDYFNSISLREGIEISKIDTEKIDVKKLFNNTNLITTIYIFIWIVLIITIVLITYFWIFNKKNNIYIFKLCGLKKSNIFIELFYEYLVMVGIGYSIGIIPTALIFKNYISYNIKLLFLMIIIILSGITACVIPMIFALNKWTNDIIRS